MIVIISLMVNSTRDIKRSVYSVFHIFIYSQCPIDYNGNIRHISQFLKRIDVLIVDIYMNATKEF